MSDEEASREELEARLEKALGRSRALEAELEEARASLRAALQDRKPRGLKDYLVWACWFLLVMALGAYLYKILLGPQEPEPPSANPTPTAAPVPSEPAKTAAGPVPAKPKEKKAPVTEKTPRKEGENLRFPGFPDVSPNTGK